MRDSCGIMRDLLGSKDDLQIAAMVTRRHFVHELWRLCRHCISSHRIRTSAFSDVFRVIKSKCRPRA